MTIKLAGGVLRKEKEMARKLIYCLCLFVGAAAGSAHADVLYCQTTLSTGFMKQDGRWRRVPFEGDRFTMKFNEDLTSVKISSAKSPYRCETAYLDRLEGVKHIRFCISEYFNGDTMLFNTKTLRFHLSSLNAFSWVTDQADTSNTDIGTCEKF